MTPEREMEIRASVALTRYDRREPGDSPGEQIRDTLAALDAEREKVARLERERDELAAQLACDACDGSGVAVSGPCGCGGRGLPEMLRAVRVALHDVTRERDELAAQLAALREAAGPAAQAEYASDEETRTLRIALAASAPAVEAYTRRVQAEALESAATVFRGNQKRCEARLPVEIVDVADARREALAEAWCAAASECEVRARELRGGR